MRKLSMIAIATFAMILAACGNGGSNTNSDTKSNAENKEAPTEVAYEQFAVEKYGVTIDVPKGMRRTDNPVMDNGACWTLVPENDNDFPIYAAMDLGVYESFLGDYTDERIQREFDEDIPEEAEKHLDLAKKEYTYSVGEDIKEFHRVIFNGNKSINVTVSYTDRWEPQLGGEVRDHIMNSVKFN